MSDDLKITVKLELPDREDTFTLSVKNVYKVAMRSKASPAKIIALMAMGMGRVFGKRVVISKDASTLKPVEPPPIKKRRGRPPKIKTGLSTTTNVIEE